MTLKQKLTQKMIPMASPIHKFKRTKIAHVIWGFWAIGVFLCFSTLNAEENQKLHVVTTTTELAHLAYRIGGDRVLVRALLEADANPHYQDARPDYLMALNRAAVFIQNGLELEIGWVPLVLKRSHNPEIQIGKTGYCDASRGINTLEKPVGRLSRKDGDIHPYGNPHYLLDPVNAAIAARNIGQTLMAKDPEHRTYYQARYKQFAQSMRSLLATELEKTRSFQGLAIAVYHKEFSYLIGRFGFKEHSSIEEIPGVPPSAAWLKKVAEQIKKDHVKIILLAPYNNKSYANAVAKRSGAEVLVLPALVSRPQQEDAYEVGLKNILNQIRQTAKGDSDANKSANNVTH